MAPGRFLDVLILIMNRHTHRSKFGFYSYRRWQGRRVIVVPIVDNDRCDVEENLIPRRDAIPTLIERMHAALDPAFRLAPDPRGRAQFHGEPHVLRGTVGNDHRVENVVPDDAVVRVAPSSTEEAGRQGHEGFPHREDLPRGGASAGGVRVEYHVREGVQRQEAMVRQRAEEVDAGGVAPGDTREAIREYLMSIPRLARVEDDATERIVPQHSANQRIHLLGGKGRHFSDLETSRENSG